MNFSMIMKTVQQHGTSPAMANGAVPMLKTLLIVCLLLFFVTHEDSRLFRGKPTRREERSGSQTSSPHSGGLSHYTPGCGSLTRSPASCVSTATAGTQCSLGTELMAETANEMLTLTTSEGVLWGVNDTARGGEMAGEPRTLHSHTAQVLSLTAERQSSPLLKYGHIFGT